MRTNRKLNLMPVINLLILAGIIGLTTVSVHSITPKESHCTTERSDDNSNENKIHYIIPLHSREVSDAEKAMIELHLNHPVMWDCDTDTECEGMYPELAAQTNRM